MFSIRLLAHRLAILALAWSSLWGSDLLIVNGHVYTGNPKQPWAQALAIAGTRITTIGTNEEVLRRRACGPK